MNKISLTVLAIALVAFSCKKPPEEEPPTDNTTDLQDEFKMSVTSMWGDESFAYDTEYAVDGIPVKFQDLRLLLSEFHLFSDGTEEQIMENSAALIDAGLEGEFTIRDLELTHIHDMECLLGLDSLTNHADPTLAESPLNDATMHWGWAPEEGYKFIRIEGTRDLIGDGTFTPFAIHAATDELKRELEFDVHQDVENDAIVASLTIDFEQFFSGVDLSGDPLTGTHGNGSKATAVIDNAVGAITID